MSMFAAAMIGVLAAMFLALVRAIMGPTVFDRVMAANMFGTKTVLLIAADQLTHRQAKCCARVDRHEK